MLNLSYSFLSHSFSLRSCLVAWQGRIQMWYHRDKRDGFWDAFPLPGPMDHSWNFQWYGKFYLLPELRLLWCNWPSWFCRAMSKHSYHSTHYATIWSRSSQIAVRFPGNSTSVRAAQGKILESRLPLASSIAPLGSWERQKFCQPRVAAQLSHPRDKSAVVSVNWPGLKGSNSDCLFHLPQIPAQSPGLSAPP